MRYTEAPARRAELVRRLEAEGYVSSAAVAEELGVSEMTIRRDLRQLHEEGLARRVTGGASLGRALPFDERHLEAVADKLAIAAECARLIVGAPTVALDAGTTVAPLAGLLEPGTRIISHSAPVIAACTERSDVELIGVGGSYQRETRSFAGPAARAAIAGLFVDVAVLSATAIGPSGVMSASALDAELKRELCAIADRVILLADHTKLSARAPIRVGALSLIDAVVTDAAATKEQCAMLSRAGIEVVVAAIPANEHAS